jgi:hypothetical protein
MPIAFTHLGPRHRATSTKNRSIMEQKGPVLVPIPGLDRYHDLCRGKGKWQLRVNPGPFWFDQ